MTICRERGNIFKQSASRSFTSEISGLRKQYGMRGWRNWQTRTFEVRVVYPWGFESPPSHQKPVHIVCWFFFLCEGGNLEQGGGIYAASKATVQQRRPQPAAETGRSCWGRVLIFQSPAKGLRKNQLTQPVAVFRKRPKPHQRKMVRIWIALLHQKPVHIVCWFFFLCEGGDLEQGGGIYAASKATVRLCLACGSQPVGMSIRGVPILYRFLFVRGSRPRTTLFII